MEEGGRVALLPFRLRVDSFKALSSVGFIAPGSPAFITSPNGQR